MENAAVLAAARPGVAPHLQLGRKGEQLAARHLQKLGFVVLSRNWRCREGELDLVVTDGRTLVVCEVKTRAGERFGDPAEAVTPAKVARIRRITGQWLRAFCVNWCAVRFDVITVLVSPAGATRLRHFPGAF
ncbi:YraN family protein [Amycolatopsis sp.]|uniref:YraN family protein n=1 Tax=Amycolatopsis sp. TaxID=37632 RepID=UPI002C5C21C4|nr:YraN family protein [Amycolatopsis sp.]HVV13723.1 YraN family protein [Amycolatopsis sp.]